MIKKLSVALVAMSIVAIAQPAVGQSSDAAYTAAIAKQVAIREATGKLRAVQAAGQIERMQTVTAQRLLIDKALQAVVVAGPSEATAARAALLTAQENQRSAIAAVDAKIKTAVDAAQAVVFSLLK